MHLADFNKKKKKKFVYDNKMKFPNIFTTIQKSYKIN